MRHRGPDAEGAYARPWAWVGQTRLSVIDLEHGYPPIVNEDATIGVALNGEIYNYRELREESIAPYLRFGYVPTPHTFFEGIVSVPPGHGGDELFAGYERFAAGLAAQRFARLPASLRWTVRGGLELLPASAGRGRAGSLQRFARVAELGLPDAFGAWVSCVGEGERRALLGGAHDGGADGYRAAWRDSEGADTLDRLLDLNLRTYMLDDLLVKAEYPAAGQARVRRAAGPLVREDIRTYLGATLGAPDARVKQHLVPAALDRLLVEHGSGARNHGHAIWTLLTFEVFLRK
ncbi:MAG: asparagine synthase-related protein [Solirubrobacteraceae bacterium]